MKKVLALLSISIALATVASLHGCSKQPPAQQGGAGSTGFETPEAAVDALEAALEKKDTATVQKILGPESADLLGSGDDVQLQAERQAFLDRYREKHVLAAGGPDDQVLQVGEDQWPLPIPLVRRDGRWYFDGEAGVHELLVRRIGANELRTIDVMRGYVDAQEDYAAEGRDGGSPGVYAQRLRSEAGKHNGLFWEPADGAPESPAGPFLAAAASEGYGDPTEAYHGYFYRTLPAQGALASGGAQSYVADGKQTGGFAAIAWPAEYGSSGIMTFMVNQDGVVWQRDLGEGTADAAAAIKEFNPDDAWTPLAPESTEDTGQVQIPNPASENCIKEGGQGRTEQSPTGGAFSVCYFEDNYQCEEWALLRGDCRKPGVRITGYATGAGRFCAITGGTYAATAGSDPERGTCTFKGKSCDADAYYRGDCSLRN